MLRKFRETRSKSAASEWAPNFKQRWRRTRKYGFTLLLTASLLMSSFEQLAVAQERPESDTLASFVEWVGQIGEELQDENGTLYENVTYGEEESFSVTDAVYGLPVKISTASGGAPGTGNSTSASVSGDGRYVAFVSAGTNLVDGDTNGKQDVFLHDRQLGTTKRISFGAGGIQSNGDSYAPYASFDGSYVLFTSKATNLVSGDTNNLEDLFLYDAAADSVQRVASVVSGSEYVGAGSSYGISADGRYVAYAGKPGSTGDHDIWLLDRRANVVKRVARQNYIYETFRARVSISADGRFIAFDSRGTKIVPDDTRTTIGNNDRAIYLYDAALDEMKMISRSTTGQRANHYSYYPIISADGRYVAYLSKASDIVPGDTQPVQDVYVYDRVNGTTELASLNSQGQQVAVDAYDPSISADGRYVAFHTDGAFDPVDGHGGIGFHRPDGDDLAARLAEFAQRRKGALDDDADFLPRFAQCRRKFILPAIDETLGNRPGRFILPGPEGTAGMDKQNLGFTRAPAIDPDTLLEHQRREDDDGQRSGVADGDGLR